MSHKTIEDIEPYRRTLAALDNAALATADRCLSVISSPNGTGKTTCARGFLRRHPEHILVCCPPHVLLANSVRPLLTEIAAALDLATDPRARTGDRLSGLIGMIVTALAHRGGMLLLDEAEALTTPAANLARKLGEWSGRSVCYLGAPRIRAVLLRDPALSSRVYYAYEVQPITVADLLKLFPRTYREDACAEIVRVTQGNIRLVFQLWPHLANAKAEVGYEGLDAQSVRDVAEDNLLLRAA